MAFVPIPKDLTQVKTKFVLGLTKRQIVCFGGAAAVGLPLFFLLRGVVPTSAASLLMVIVMLPFFLLAMYEKHGQPLEKVVQNIIQNVFIRPKIRPYQTDNAYAAAERQAKLYKEVKAIVTGNKAIVSEKKAKPGRKNG